MIFLKLYLLGVFVTWLLCIIVERKDNNPPLNWDNEEWLQFFAAGVMCPLTFVVVFCMWFKESIYPHLVKERGINNNISDREVGGEL